MDQLKLDDIYRTKCLVTGEEACNIYNWHDVAIEVGCACEYGCCCKCKLVNECGVRCSTAASIAYKKKHLK